MCSPAVLGPYQPLKDIDYLQPDMEAWIDSMVVDSPQVWPRVVGSNTAELIILALNDNACLHASKYCL